MLAGNCVEAAWPAARATLCVGAVVGLLWSVAAEEVAGDCEAVVVTCWLSGIWARIAAKEFGSVIAVSDGVASATCGSDMDTGVCWLAATCAGAEVEGD